MKSFIIIQLKDTDSTSQTGPGNWHKSDSLAGPLPDEIQTNQGCPPKAVKDNKRILGMG